MLRIDGVVQHYAWGDPLTLPRLMGRHPDGRPWAEVWFGTHHGGMATLSETGTLLVDAVGELPYLVKFLAAAQPLSLQTHPDRDQAAAGFARENEAGIPVDAAARIYRDTGDKPEMIIALSPFEALCGFRPVDDTLHLLAALGCTALAERLARTGLPATVAAIYERAEPLDAVIAACARSQAPAAQLVVDLAARYPHDPSIAVTLLLHRITLAPGEAIFLGPGNLHAYLHGTGVEVMSSSDNVVRGGLTSKHVDVAELLRIVSCTPIDDPRLAPTVHDADTWSYDTPGTPFRTWRLDVDGHRLHVATGTELLLGIDGAVTATAGTGGTAELRPGSAVVLTASDPVSLDGAGTLIRVEPRAD